MQKSYLGMYIKALLGSYVPKHYNWSHVAMYSSYVVTDLLY